MQQGAGRRQLRRLDAWRLGVSGAFWGYEVTHRTPRGWHAHLHAIVVVAPGQREADVRAGLGRGWRWAASLRRVPPFFARWKRPDNRIACII
jgi:hypothetical protein